MTLFTGTWRNLIYIAHRALIKSFLLPFYFLFDDNLCIYAQCTHCTHTNASIHPFSYRLAYKMFGTNAIAPSQSHATALFINNESFHRRKSQLLWLWMRLFLFLSSNWLKFVCVSECLFLFHFCLLFFNIFSMLLLCCCWLVSLISGFYLVVLSCNFTH